MNLLFHTLFPDFLTFTLGLILGIFYFSCLWFTVQHLTHTQHPVLLIVGSGIGRLSVALLSLYFIVGGDWERLIIALLGFLLARTLLIAHWRPRSSFNNLILED